MMTLPPELCRMRDELRGYAVEYGLDFFEVLFEMLDWRQINEVAAFGGFPNRYPHWRFGMEYEQLAKSYTYGLSKIYEMVINNDPCYAYLLHSNNLVDQKLVMAHVYAHSDFFKNNIYFAHTNRKMMDEMANHRTRVMRYIDRIGYDKVESFIDACLSLETLIDYHGVAIRRAPARPHIAVEREGEADGPVVRKLGTGARHYMERYLNPPEFLEAQQKKLEEERQREKNFPERPQRDVLQFLTDYAPLDGWERDILSIVREEAVYFSPQAQTKIMNEGWACVTGETRILTDRGALPAREIVMERLPVRVCDGAAWRRVTDWAHFPSRTTVRVQTRRGFVLEGSATHQVLTEASPDSWRRLDALSVGDSVALCGQRDSWSLSYQGIQWTPQRRTTLNDVAAEVGVDLSTVIRHHQGRHVSRSAAALAPALAVYESSRSATAAIKSRHPLRVPEYVSEHFARFLGYLIGDGHISRVKRVVGLTTMDSEAREDFVTLGGCLFGLEAHVRRDGGRWRISYHAEDLSDLLCHLGLTVGPSARFKTIPEVIWRSPASVVQHFLRAYFDCDGHAGPQGVILSTFSEALASGVQQLLLQCGILSRRRHAGGGWHVHVTGHSAIRFADQIHFGISRKRDALECYIANHQQWKEEEWTDEVASVAVGRQDVYDFTVEQTHRYVAHGFVNHNSYWHSKIMTQRALKDSEVIDYADHHAGVVAMTPQRINPYKVGIELYRDIEDRWNRGRFGKEYEECTDMRVRAKWDRQLGLGRQKIFEVRKIYNDITFLDEFLTPEFCREHRMFVYSYNLSSDQYEIADRTFEKIKKQLLNQLTNAGQPTIDVVDANYGNRGELLLKHQHDGVDLRYDYAQETLKNLFRIWRRPVNIETVVEGVPKILSYDGQAPKEFRP